MLALAALGGAAAWAQCPPDAPVRLLSPEAVPGDKVGSCVATDGQRIAVGSLKSTGFLDVAGAVDVYERVPALTGPWTHLVRLRPTPLSTDDSFGNAVALRADTLAVGAQFDSSRRGAVYIFKETGKGWIQAQKLTANDGAPSDFFGSSIALDGDRLVIGAYGDQDAGPNTGSAYVFERPDGASPFAQAGKLLAPDPVTLNEFGADVAISGGFAMAGASSRNGGRGAVYVFERQGAVWTWTQTLTASDGAVNDFFGEAIALDGDTALLATGKRNGPAVDAGGVYVFRLVAGAWTQQGGAITASDAAANARFGATVSLDGDAALVGANRDSEAGAVAGAVYVLRRDNAGAPFTERDKLTLPGADANDQFGWSVAIAGGAGAAGAPFNNDQGAEQGAAAALDLPAPCPADLTCDGLVNSADLAGLLGAWGPVLQGAPEDLNGDGFVGSPDLAGLLGAWGSCP